MENTREKKENTILIVDDEKVNRLNLRKILGDTYEILEAENGQQAIDILEGNTEKVAAIVLDLIMPDFNGYEFMKAYSQSKTFGTIPVVIATVSGDTATERECLELGAWDFVGKPYDARIIQFRVKNVIDRSQNQMSKELRYRTQYSDIAPIYNMSMFYYVTRQMLDRYSEEKFAFIRMDIEKFRLVNILFGREEGNKLLQHISTYMSQLMGQYEHLSFGHISADVFCVCFSYKDEDEIYAFMERTNEIVKDYPLDFELLLTYGIYLIEDSSMSVSEIYECAHSASKNCKSVYIRNYAFFEKKMRDTIVKEQMIANKMHSALKNGEFVLYIQPKYELQKNMIYGGEVLVRWIDPEWGMVSPGDFIPVFEENGFIMQLDFYIWEQACKLLRKWLDEGHNPYPISVNLSRVSLYNSQLINILCGLCDKYNVPPYLLQIELTESAYTKQNNINSIMTALQEKGFTILMDDFGSGYSSLNVLKDIEVDVLKIDMKFMSRTEKEARSENILAAVVRMAKWLNLPVIAEGVELKEQVMFLKSIGCEYVQGYYFARPMPVEEYEKMAFNGSGHFIEAADEPNQKVDAIWSSTSQIEIIFSNMLQAVAVYEYSDGEIEVLRVNDAYYDMFGFSGVNDVKCGLECSLTEESHQAFVDAFEEAVLTKDMSECEVLRQIGDLQIWIHVSLKYMSKVGGKHVIYGCISDITSQKKIAAELEKYREVVEGVKDDQTIQETLLIVDDSEINRASLHSIFESKYRILEAENGKAALEVLAAEEYRVDAILLDLVMPEMDGLEFLAIKKDMSAIANMPTVIITADDSPEQQADIMRMGANEYIVKPFIPEIVIRRVENVLDSARSFRRILHSNNA